MDRLKSFIHKPAGFATVATLVTVILVGGVALAVSPLGCDAASKLGYSAGARCAARTAALVTPSVPAATSTASSIPSTGPTILPTPRPTPSPTRDPSYAPHQYGISAAYPPLYEGTSKALPAIGVSCRLPIYAGGPGTGGFLVFPSRQFIADPRSAVSTPPAPPGNSPPPQSGGSSRFFGLSYDKALARWLPVPRSWVTPDGKRYAYPGDDGVYIVDIAAGTQTEIAAGQKWGILDVEAAGVYATRMSTTGQSGAGLWLLPFSGAAKQLTATGFWTAVGAGAAYGTATLAVPPGAANTILRFDLKALKTQNWFVVETAVSTVVGFDVKGAPLIQDSWYGPAQYGQQAYQSQIWIVPALQQGYVIANNPQFAGPVADSHGIWFSGDKIYLFIPGKGTYAAANVNGQLAGGCS